MASRIAFCSLIAILTFQLVTLRPSVLSFATYEVGEFGVVVERAKSYGREMYTKATLSAASKPTYDSVVFTGDVMLGRHVEELMRRHGAEYPFAGFSMMALSAEPAVVGNFESAMARNHIQTPALAMRFSTAPEYVGALGDTFTHLSLANNHSLDYGEEGYSTAVNFLEAAGISTFGHNQSINKSSLSYIETNRGRIALIGLNATARIPTEAEIATVCERAKKQSDFQAVYIHWGDEYQPTHSETQELLATLLIDTCADLIIGHHPHVVQDIDIIKGVPVFYSLGNYVFDQYFSQEVMEGLVVLLQFEPTPHLELIPVSSLETQSVPVPLQGEERVTFLQNLSQKSHPSLQTTILTGTINLIEPVATSTKMAMMSR